VELPPSLAADLRPTLPDLAEEMIVAIGHEVPDYRRPLRGPFGRALRMGVEGALNRFVDAIEDPSAEQSSDLMGTYAELGRLEFHAGRSMDALQSAYRLGARMAWERFIVAASEQPPEVLYKLAAEIFSYIDRISAESVEGFVTEQSVAEAQRGRRRAAVARLLARGIESDEELRAVAKEAGWRPPATVAGLVAAGEDADRFAGRIGADCVALAESGVILAFVTDPDGPGRQAQVKGALGGTIAVIGPTVAVDRSHLSLARAQAAHDLVRDGIISDAGPVIRAEQYLVDLMLRGDPVLAAEIAARALKPLADLKPGSRERLTATLRAWLDNPGQISRIAETLHVHPQTVRYRVGQLRELFGERLEDPDSRFELQLAVRSAVSE
jgi:hypothetical protein